MRCSCACAVIRSPAAHPFSLTEGNPHVTHWRTTGNSLEFKAMTSPENLFAKYHVTS